MNAGKTTISVVIAIVCVAAAALAQEPIMSKEDAASALMGYFEAVSVPKPFQILTGDALAAHQKTLRARILADVSLDPLPERIDLDVHKGEPIDHPWCTITKLQYQLWPGVYTDALLFMPKEFKEKPAPAVLCPHGHWDHGNAFPDVQKRCIVLAKMGYVVLSPTQNHTESPLFGLSNQTLMIWVNMRGLDYLQSLPEVNPNLIGCSGASGGGLQTQMITALDERVKAATIVGLTCDFRELLFPWTTHCGCNHFPNFMTYTDFPEIAALACPRAVQFLTMNDWTRHFPYDNFPAIQELYRVNGVPESTACTYWPTEHIYDKVKRERTYWWMEKFLRQNGDRNTAIPEEPEDIAVVYPPEVLENWPVENPNNKGLNHLAEIFIEKYHYTQSPVTSQSDWTGYKNKMVEALPKLLGLDAKLASAGATEDKGTDKKDGVKVQRLLLPSEASLMLPALLLRPSDETKPASRVTVVLTQSGSAPDQQMINKYKDRARAGEWVVMPDVRFTGAYNLTELAGLLKLELRKFVVATGAGPAKDPAELRKGVLTAWERNSWGWGRPLVGMVTVDIQHVLDGLKAMPGANMENIRIETRDSAFLGLAAAFAAALDQRIRQIDVDLLGCRYEDGHAWSESPDELPAIPFILRHGDVLQWLGVLGDREVTARNLKATPDDVQWLRQAFGANGNEAGLHVEEKES